LAPAYVAQGRIILELLKLTTKLSTNTMNENAELQNGRWAMIGIFAAIGTYALTGQIIPGLF